MSHRPHRIALALGCAALLPLFLFAQGTAFTYQGFLQQADAPADGAYDFQFQLSTDASGSALIGSTLQFSSVAVQQGLFVVELDFGNLFDGGPRWLKIAVRSSGSLDFTALSPLQALTATPYAIRSVNSTTLDGQPLSFVRDASNLNAGTLADARIPSAVTRDNEVLALVLAGDGSGSGLDADRLDGMNSTEFVRSTGPTTISGTDNANPILTVTQGGSYDGISASSQSTAPGEAAVKGRIGAAGPTINSSAGVFGTSQALRGVIGSSTNSDGVLGYSTSLNGVQGQSSTGVGVRGFSNSGHGVYGFTASETGGHAVYADGTVAADKLVYHTPHTRYHSISGDAFKPRRIASTTDMISAVSGAGSYFLAAPSGSDSMIAPVHLPDGAVVRAMALLYWDSSTTTDLRASFYRHSDAGTLVLINNTSSTGSSGNGTTIVLMNEPVDNATHFYEVILTPDGADTWPTLGSALRVRGIRFTYEISEAH